jgi:hypothetical protein
MGTGVKNKKKGTNTKTHFAKQKARDRFLNRHIDQVRLFPLFFSPQNEFACSVPIVQQTMAMHLVSTPPTTQNCHAACQSVRASGLSRSRAHLFITQEATSKRLIHFCFWQVWKDVRADSEAEPARGVRDDSALPRTAKQVRIFAAHTDHTHMMMVHHFGKFLL